MRRATAILAASIWMTGSVLASTGNIEGVIKSTGIGGGSLVITGLNHYEHGEQAEADHVIPNKGTPIYILDGTISTRETTLKVGRRATAFCYRNRTVPNFVVSASERQ